MGPLFAALSGQGPQGMLDMLLPRPVWLLCVRVESSASLSRSCTMSEYENLRGNIVGL